MNPVGKPDIELDLQQAVIKFDSDAVKQHDLFNANPFTTKSFTQTEIDNFDYDLFCHSANNHDALYWIDAELTKMGFEDISEITTTPVSRPAWVHEKGIKHQRILLECVTDEFHDGYQPYESDSKRYTNSKFTDLPDEDMKKLIWKWNLPSHKSIDKTTIGKYNVRKLCKVKFIECVASLNGFMTAGGAPCDPITPIQALDFESKLEAQRNLALSYEVADYDSMC